MNLIHLVAAPVPEIASHPALSQSAWLILASLALFVIALIVVGHTVKDRTSRAITFAMTVIIGLGLLTGSIVFTVHDSARGAKEIDAWDATTAEWAADRYGVRAGMSGLITGRDAVFPLLEPAPECPTDLCYFGKVLIGDTLTPVTLVIIDETPILVSGGEEESQKELPVIGGTTAAVEPGA